MFHLITRSRIFLSVWARSSPNVELTRTVPGVPPQGNFTWKRPLLRRQGSTDGPGGSQWFGGEARGSSGSFDRKLDTGVEEPPKHCAAIIILLGNCWLGLEKLAPRASLMSALQLEFAQHLREAISAPILCRGLVQDGAGINSQTRPRLSPSGNPERRLSVESPV